MSSIYDIAKLTGFSSTTVARALSNKGYCKPKTKEIIYEAASTLNYTPNLSAKTLRNNRTQRILLCIPDICNPFYFRMIQGASKVLEENDYYVMLCSTEKEIAKELKMLSLLQQKYCDGVILISFNFCEENIGAIRRIGRPVILGNRYLGQREDDPFDYVYVDHIYGMELAADHLFDKGCKNVLLLTGSREDQTSRERTEGFLRALGRRSLPEDPAYIVDCRYNTSGAYEAFNRFLERGLPVDGVIAANDLAAYGVLRSCREHGLSVPGDLRLVSFDNTDYALVSSPTLTSVDMCQYSLGEQLALRLLERIEGNTKIRNITLKPTLVERESSE